MNSLTVERMDNGRLSLIFRDVFVLALLFALPSAGVLLMPMALYLRSRYGLFTGKRVVFCAVILAAPLVFWLSSLATFLLSATFFAAGFVLVKSADCGDGPLLALGKAALTLAVLWAALLVAASLMVGENIYQALVVALQAMLHEAASYPLGDAASPEARAMVAETIRQARRLLPVVLPAMMLTPALVAPMAAILLCNVVESLRDLPRRWIDFRLWRLPDVLVWLGIILVCAVSMLFDGWLYFVAVNALILLALAYAMQGLAVMKFFFDSRRLPVAAQLVLIFLVVSQSFGLLALAILGLIEVWADFRRLGRRKPQSNHDKE
ncbi:MAG: YybS family protein [Desulfobulbaceae bacterium]|jgi:uncharacterized protein YybS (DUF2232 family)|nr:YybS family protein [Desulfobulbaceae bacterium]